jgi:hypothetical protein
MTDFLPISISLIVVTAIVLLISRRFTISSRYERGPKAHTPWSALDSGIDPTDEEIVK